eukprot:UN06025
MATRVFFEEEEETIPLTDDNNNEEEAENKIPQKVDWTRACPCYAKGIALECAYLWATGTFFGFIIWTHSYITIEAALQSDKKTDFANKITTKARILLFICVSLLLFEFMKFVGKCLKWDNPRSRIRVWLFLSNMLFYSVAIVIFLISYGNVESLGPRHIVLLIGILELSDFVMFCVDMIIFFAINKCAVCDESTYNPSSLHLQ